MNALKKIAEKGSHPHIIQVIGLRKARNSSLNFIDMELCDLSLDVYIYNKKPMDELFPFYYKNAPPPSKAQKIWYIMAHIAKGVEFMHSFGAVHRDLKPSNGKDL